MARKRLLPALGFVQGVSLEHTNDRKLIFIVLRPVRTEGRRPGKEGSSNSHVLDPEGKPETWGRAAVVRPATYVDGQMTLSPGLPGASPRSWLLFRTLSPPLKIRRLKCDGELAVNQESTQN